MPHVRSWNRLAAIVTTLAVALTITAELSAQRRGGRRNRAPEPSARLGALTALSCDFPASASGVWTGADPKASVDPPASFKIRFSRIDVQEGTADAVGLGEPVEVTVQLVGRNMHLLDIRPNGDLAVTTVFDEEMSGGRLKAVHSRSQYGGAGGSGPVVGQYYGTCTPS